MEMIKVKNKIFSQEHVMQEQKILTEKGDVCLREQNNEHSVLYKKHFFFNSTRK